MANTIDFTVTMTAIECANCHLIFGVPEFYERDLRQSHENFYCPKGHSLSFKGESDLEKARREAREATRRAERAQTRATMWQDQAEAERRSKVALKGHLTRARNRVANGVCPVPGCRRNFADVRDHIAGQHPDWHLTDPETGKAATL